MEAFWPSASAQNSEVHYIGFTKPRPIHRVLTSRRRVHVPTEELDGVFLDSQPKRLIRALTAAAVLGSRTVSGANAAPGVASEPVAWTHGIALLGNLKYPANFARFDYVNARAPKAGIVRRSVVGTYDSFNLVVAGVKGNLVEGIDLIYDTLMVLRWTKLPANTGSSRKRRVFQKISPG